MNLSPSTRSSSRMRQLQMRARISYGRPRSGKGEMVSIKPRFSNGLVGLLRLSQLFCLTACSFF
jgi:hypothetical protein